MDAPPDPIPSRGRGRGGKGGRRANAGRWSLEKRELMDAAAEAARQVEAADIAGSAESAEQAVGPVGEVELAAALSPLHLPEDVLSDMSTRRSSAVACPALAKYVRSFAIVGKATGASVGEKEDTCIRQFVDSNCNALHNISLTARSLTSGLNRLWIQKVERRMAAAIDLGERQASADLQVKY